MSFIKKHWKVILFISVVIIFIILCFTISKVLGGTGIMIASLWRLITKKKSDDQVKHDEKINKLNDRLKKVDDSIIEVDIEYNSKVKELETLDEEINEIKNSTSSMTLEDMLKYGNDNFN